MTAHLLAIAIGPVQDFIAAGRKTRDLWFGSAMLAEVSRQAAEAVKRTGANLIFPDDNAVESRQPVANKILAWVEEGIAPKDVAAAAHKAALNQLAAYRDQMRTQLDKPKPLEPHLRWRVGDRLIDDQLADFLEFAAAWLPVDPASYGESRREVELLLAGRKALRDFAPAPSRDGVPKSSLDPSRDSVVDWPDNDAEAERLRRRLRLKGAEQLDGVSLIKRLAEPRRFVSVARVAIDPFIRRAASDRPEKLAALAAQAEAMAAADHPSVERFPTTAASGLEGYAAFPFDTQLFYDDGRSDADLRDRTGRDPQKQAERKQAAAFFQAAEALRRDLGIDELPKYFAVLVADGDHMGAAISAMTKRADHQRLSQRLAGFAAEADAIVRSHHGAMVYSGGDDVLAFLPLDRALTCADRLRQAFTKTMDGATGATAVSLSVGLAIGHYGEQLQRLLAWGRDAERAAKTPREPRRPRDTARNALAVSLHTRGAGEGRLVVHGWDEKPVTRRWDQWVAWHRADEIPDSAAFELSGLERELRSLWPDPDDDSPAANERRERYRDLLRREALRILGRRRSQHGGTPMEKTQRGAMADLIGDDPAALRRVADELLIARRLAAAADIAAEPRASPPVDEPAVAATGADGAGGRR